MKKKKLITAIKQATAGLLAGAMVLTGMPLGSITAHAMVLQPNYQLFANAPTGSVIGPDLYRNIPVVKIGSNTFGGSQGTAFVFGKAYTGTNAYGIGGVTIPGTYNSFNIGALLDRDSVNNNPQKGYNNVTRSAYSNNWWTTYYGFGRTAEAPYNTLAGPNGLLPMISPEVTSWSGLRPMAASAPDTASMGVFLAGNDGEVVEVPVPTNYSSKYSTGSSPNKIEVRMEVKPTPDEQKILITWTGYNPNSYPVHFWIGAEADTMVAGTDTSPSIISDNQKHLHMIDYFNQGISSNWAYRGDFATIKAAGHVNDTALTDFDARLVGDGEGRVWAGEYDDTASLAHRSWVFSTNKDNNILVQQGDAAAGFSGYLPMESGEVKSVSFEVSMRAAVYYVDPGYTAGDSNGYLAQPFTKLEDAVSAIGQSGAKKAYIYVAGPTEVENTITIPANLDLQIETSPYNTGLFAGKFSRGYFPLGGDPEKSNTEIIKRATNLTGPMFKVNNASSTLSFYNITIDGNKSNVVADSPILDISAGEVKVTDKTTIQNNAVAKIGSSEPTASAIHVSGSGVLTLNALDNPVSITGNESRTSGTEKPVSAITVNDNASNNMSAATLDGVKFARARAINVAGDVTVDGNKNKFTNPDSTVTESKANVNLGKSMLNVEKGRQLSGTIGVSIGDAPQTTSDQDGRPVIDYAGRPGDTIPYSPSNVPSDIDGISVGMGVASAWVTDGAGAKIASAPQDTKVVYYKAQKFDYTVSYIDPDGNTMKLSDLTMGSNTIPGTIDAGNKYAHAFRAAAGSDVSIPMPTHTGYAFGSATGAVAPLIVDTTPGSPTLGNISGKTPARPVDIVINFIRNEVRYKFDSKGGSNVGDKTEAVSAGASTLGALPQPTKTGYDFVEWRAYTDTNGDGSFKAADGDVDLGTFSGYPAPSAAATTYLYAVWTPGPDLYKVTTYHKNSNPALPLTFGSDIDLGHQIEAVVDKDHISVPGYRYGTATWTPVSAGTLEPNPSVTPGIPEGRFHIASMPASDVNLNYKYTVDPSQTFTFTVRHLDALGNALPNINTLTQTKRAEQSISAQPETNVPGYSYSTYHITAGENDGAPGSYVLGLNHVEDTQTPYIVSNDPGTGSFVGFMPNQNVSIDYIYTADSGMNLVRRYYDRITNKLLTSQVEAQMPGGIVSASIPALGSDAGNKLYGYLWDASSTVIKEDVGNPGVDYAGISVNAANGDLTGSMPPNGNGVKADYKLSRDASKWRNINFVVANAPYNNGAVNPLPAGAPTSFLASDGGVGSGFAYDFNRLKTDGYVPDVTPSRYYMFAGWFKDAAATIAVGDGDTFPTDSAPLVLYAKFVEDPSKWIDINFVAGSNGSISAPSSMHIPYDYTWSQIASQLPMATPVANYNFNGWKDAAGNQMAGASTLTNKATYTAIFSMDPATWGTNVGAVSPRGRIGSDGSGEIVIDGTTPGNVYVISEPSGKIIAVVPGDANGNVTVVPDMIPGAHYNVQEGTPDTVANIGSDISTVSGTAVSAPKDVYIPTVENNYNVGYDPNNEGMARIVVNPADPDAEYALIDEAGNVLKYPGSDNGWMTPVGSNPSTVTFDNLNPNETYTVVARRKGDSRIPDPLAKLPDGNQIVANPGDMADAVKYIVETRNGTIVSVGDTSVGADAYSEAKAKEVVKIHAEPTDSNGKNFLYWSVLAGRAVGVSGKITQADYTFTLSNSNIVLKAVYEPVKVAGDDADLTERIRGGAEGEFGLEPSQIPGLAHDLTTELDRSLIGVNGANVEYRVIFNKRDAKSVEVSAVKPLSVSGINHVPAYTAAYGLDIEVERYVNGRLVGRATDSNATVDVVAQLPGEDTDQLDYQLFDVTPDALGNITPIEVAITTDAANNAGLLKFSGNLMHSYVLVYSKAFKITFVDNKPVLDHLHLNDTSRNFYHRFKVRRKESVEESYYSTDYDVVTAYARNDVANNLKSPFEDIYGVQYDYVNWSTKEDKLALFDTAGAVTKRTVVFAYYKDNRVEVAKARVDLGNTIETARDLTGDIYLKVGEVEELNAAIAHAVETLRKARDLVSPDGTTYLRQANYEELQQAIDALRELIDKYSKLARQREDERNRRTGGASGGGNTSSGRGSKLLTPGEKSGQNTALNENSNTLVFMLGVDGKWERNPVTGGWSFVLNGGTPLNDIWGKISFKDSTGKEISRWYYFDKNSTMATGWIYDTKHGYWYFMNPNEGSELGQMVTGWVADAGKWYYMNENTGILETGWHLDPQDNRWYFLDNSGAMLTGWQNIGEKYYYLNPIAPQQNSYEWDASAFKWNYVNKNTRPYGSMYAGETTPDGYSVDANGVRN